MLLLRLSPLIPYNALDYISGVTSISVSHYCLALVGLLPGTVTLCYIGATASSLADGTSAASENKGLRTTILVLGLLFAVAGGAVASYYSKIELDKILQQESEQQLQQQGGLMLLVADAQASGERYQDIEQTSDHSST